MSTVAERPTNPPDKRAKHMIPEDLVLRCVVFKSAPGEFTAECIDLDLMVHAKNPHDAFQSLKTAVVGYLKVVLEGDPKGLVPRPSPFGHRIRYHFFALRAALTITALATRTFLVSDWSPGNCPAL